jgi:hypothetical protein
MKVWVLVIGAAVMAALVSSASYSTITPRQAQASKRQNVVVEDTTSVYDDVFGPETDVGVIGGDNRHILGFAPKASEASIPDPGSNNATGHAEAGKRTVPGFADTRDCADGICTIYSIGGPVAGDSSDHLHVIASVPTTGGAKSFDLIGTNDNLAANTTAAFNAGADDFNSNSSGGPWSGEPLGAPDNFAYWKMH